MRTSMSKKSKMQRDSNSANLSTLPLVLNDCQLPTAAQDAQGWGVQESLAESERFRSPIVDTRMQQLQKNSSS